MSEFDTLMMTSLEINIPVMAIVMLQKGTGEGDLVDTRTGTGVWGGQMHSFFKV